MKAMKLKQLVKDEFQIYLQGPAEDTPISHHTWWAQTDFQVNLGNKNGPEYLIGKGTSPEKAIHDLLARVKELSNYDIKKGKGRCEV
jgi:hypothetical protein